MSDTAEKTALEVIEAIETSKRVRHPPLRTSMDIRRELGKLYWQAKRGELDISDASKLGNLLGILGRLTVSDSTEERLRELEDMAKQLPSSVAIRFVQGALPTQTIESIPVPPVLD